MGYHSGMASRPLPRPVLLPDDEWVGGIVPPPSDPAADGAESSRSTVAVWLDAAGRYAIASAVLPPGAPGRALADTLAKVLTDPAHESHGKRPRRVRVGDPAAVDAVRALFPGVEIVVGPVPELAGFHEAYKNVDRTPRGGGRERTMSPAAVFPPRAVAPSSPPRACYGRRPRGTMRPTTRSSGSR